MFEIILVVVGAVLGFGMSLIANVVTGPLVSLVTRYQIISMLSRIPLVSDRRFGGQWALTWDVASPGYPTANRQLTNIRSAFRVLAFAIEAEGYGAKCRYYYVGHLNGNVLSGRWYDPRGFEAYHGQFQVRLDGTLLKATGKWIGWSSSGAIKVGDLELSMSSASQ